jgi:hypothetical protein
VFNFFAVFTWGVITMMWASLIFPIGVTVGSFWWAFHIAPDSSPLGYGELDGLVNGVVATTTAAATWGVYLPFIAYTT